MKERAVIVDRVAEELNQWSIRDEIQAHLTAAGFFDLLEAAEATANTADAIGIARTGRLRDAIRRCKDGGK